MCFDKSPRYLAEIREEHRAFEAEAQCSRAAQASKPTQTDVLQSIWGAEPGTDNFVRSETKASRRAKKSDLSLTELDLNEDIEEDLLEETANLTIEVKQDSKRVFDKVFSRTATTSNFRWTHLVNALIDAGMVATQAAGSAVRFKNDRGAIVFHNPHGYNHTSTLSVEFLRNQIGKRLTKWFGWNDETFVERDKGGQH